MTLSARIKPKYGAAPTFSRFSDAVRSASVVSMREQAHNSATSPAASRSSVVDGSKKGGDTEGELQEGEVNRQVLARRATQNVVEGESCSKRSTVIREGEQ